MEDKKSQTKSTTMDYNPYAYHRPDALRLKGSVIPHVIGQTVVVTIITVIVTGLYELSSIKLSVSTIPSLAMSTSFAQIIGVVVGLLLTYRTNTAYDRYFLSCDVVIPWVP